MEQIYTMVNKYYIEIIMALTLISGLLILLFIINNIKLSIFKKKYNRLIKGTKTDNIEELLFNNKETLKELTDEMEYMKKYCSNVNVKLDKSIQNVGFIRYNAFDDMGSDLSFSLALLDKNLDGIVISSLYGRDSCNIYGKPISKGESNYKLSVEEIQAVDRAIKRNEEKPSTVSI
ncbi:DUF4446 family protein [Clostridiisalibacter paucivorans]|uniref:DUF4446 family protein n=1 Tax=Clostridiisalibacter paucivorans TaxID=408753 RepID=UPI00068604F7|nr:DUF4446 family protein [Clostridiisalibacter paucivorans]